MKKSTIIIISIIAVVGLASLWFFTKEDKTTNVSFVTAKATVGYIGKSVTATGTLEPVDTITVGAQVSGVVNNVYVDYNSVVKKGQLLATVDPSILSAQVTQAQANLLTAESNLTYQNSTYERQSKLFKLGAISAADYQTALNLYNTAKASVQSTKAQLAVAQKNLSYTKIYSPVDGVVLNKNVRAGQTIASNFSAPVLFVIAKDLTKMQVNANIDEADIGAVVAGQNASFTVDAFPNDVFKGKVQEIYLNPSVSSNVVTYATLINVDNAAMKLKPGMTASINVYTQEDSNAILIPSRAITFKPDSTLLGKYKIIKAEKPNHPIDGDNAATNTHLQHQKNPDEHHTSVWVKSGDSLIEKRIVTGVSDDTNVKVLKGLSVGDEVITNMINNAGKNGEDNGAVQSPFMPRPRGNSTGKPKN